MIQSDMSVHLTLSTFTQLVATILGLLIATILWNYSRSSPQFSFNKWLSASIFSMSCGLGVGFIVATGIALRFPHFYRVGHAFSLLIMPLAYLYIRTAVTRRPLTKWDLLHSLPLLFYLVDYMPFFLLPASAKAEILQKSIHDLNKVLAYEEGWMMPPYAHLIIRNLQETVYWLLQMGLLARVFRLQIPVLEHENRGWLRWATLYVGLQSLTFLPLFIVIVSRQWQYTYWANNGIVAFALLSLTLILFFQPSILYGIRGLIIYEKEENLPPIFSDVSVKNGLVSGIYLDYDTITTLKEKLEDLMKEKAPFLKHGYSSFNLANDLAIPPYQLSAFLNHSVGYNFNDYINEQRIRFCLGQIKSGAWKGFTLEAIGHECGFSNRNTFTSSFKKFVGQPPSIYLNRAEEHRLLKN